MQLSESIIDWDIPKQFQKDRKKGMAHNKTETEHSSNCHLQDFLIEADIRRSSHIINLVKLGKYVTDIQLAVLQPHALFGGLQMLPKHPMHIWRFFLVMSKA